MSTTQCLRFHLPSLFAARCLTCVSCTCYVNLPLSPALYFQGGFPIFTSVTFTSCFCNMHSLFIAIINYFLNWLHTACNKATNNYDRNDSAQEWLVAPSTPGAGGVAEASLGFSELKPQEAVLHPSGPAVSSLPSFL